MKLTSAGNSAWAETFGDSGFKSNIGIAVATTGDVRLGVNYRDPFDIDPDPLAIESLPGGTAQRGLLLRLGQ